MKIAIITGYIVSILSSLYLWIVVELEVKFSLGAGTEDSAFEAGLRLSNYIDVFVGIYLLLNILGLILTLKFFSKKKNQSSQFLDESLGEK